MKKFVIFVIITLLGTGMAIAQYTNKASRMISIQDVLNSHADINIGTRVNNQALVYNSATQNWENSSTLGNQASYALAKEIDDILSDALAIYIWATPTVTEIDQSGEGHTATYVNVDADDWLRYGSVRSLHLETGEYVTIADHNDWNFISGGNDANVSIGGRIKIYTDTNVKNIITKWDDTNSQIQWKVFVDADEKLNFRFYDESGGNTAYEGRITDAAIAAGWIEWGVTYDQAQQGENASDGMLIYIDGIVVASSTSDGGGTYVDKEDLDELVAIGASLENDTATDTWIGEISYIWVEQATVSAADISMLWIATRRYTDMGKGLMIQHDGTIPTWGHSPTGLAVKGTSELDGILYADSGIRIGDGTVFGIGTASAAQISWGTNGAADDLLTLRISKASASDTGAWWIARDLNPSGMTDHDDYLSPTLVLVNDEGADANDYSYVLFGPRTTADVTSAWYFDILTGTGAADGSVNGSSAELGAIFRIGASGTATTDHGLTAGGVLFEGDVEIDRGLYLGDDSGNFDGIVTFISASNAQAIIQHADNDTLQFEDAAVYAFDDKIVLGSDLDDVNGSILFIASDNDQGTIGINTSDGLDFTGFSGGITTEVGLTLTGITEALTIAGTATIDSTTITSHGTPHDLADGEYTDKTFIGLAHENLIFGDVCYMNTDTTGEYAKSQGNAAGKPGLVMALATISANNWGLFLQVGYVCRTSWTTVQTKGAWVYVDDDTAGLATTTRPPDIGDFWNVIGYCAGTDIMFFNPDYTVVEVP